MSTKKLQILDSLIKNADMLDGKHADEFASVSDLEGLATEAFVTNKISEAQLSGGDTEIDLSGYATKDDLSDMVGDSPVASQISTAIGAIDYPVDSVNGKTGTITLSASDVSAVPTTRTVNGKALSANITLSASDVSAAPTSHASTATTYGAASASNYGHAMASSTTPKALGTAAVGSETAKFARGDHVHALPALTSCTGTLTVAQGGTGATTARDAVNNLGLREAPYIGSGDYSDITDLSGLTLSGSFQVAGSFTNAPLTNPCFISSICGTNGRYTQFGWRSNNTSATKAIYMRRTADGSTWDDWTALNALSNLTDVVVATSTPTSVTNGKWYLVKQG